MRIGKYSFHYRWAGKEGTTDRNKPPICKWCGKRVRFVSAKSHWTYQHVICLLRNR